MGCIMLDETKMPYYDGVNKDIDINMEDVINVNLGKYLSYTYAFSVQCR